jgi:DNA (cytosine-5)-methyltransferase 1
MSQKNLKKKKLERVARGGKVRCLDLFSGCGGLSLGFHAAGCEIIGAVEYDSLAARSHAINFHRRAPDEVIDLHAGARDITQEEPESLINELGLTPPEEAIDIIIGGPPCQAFARVGRAKLREVAEHPEAFRLDPRANLYLRYLHYVEKLQPLALLMENVPDVLNYGGHNIAEEMCEALEDLGYECAYTLLNAAFYGVPQMRERLFLIGYARELKASVSFPRPSHWIQLPKGYEGSRQVALKALFQADLFYQDNYYISPPQCPPGLPPAITAREAIGDLPSITLHLSGDLKRGARRFNEIIPYPKNGRLNPYVKLMRNWPGFGNREGISDHVIRSLPRDYAIFRRMNPGDQYPEAYQHALDLFQETLASYNNGKTIRPGTEAYKRLMRQIVPPYDSGKFPNKWRKMEADMPARTLMAHLGKDSYSHIHYDSDQARTISVREAARLQSFPDGFIFAGTMNPAFRQIGNAVPPLLAKAIGEEIMRALRGEK